METWRKFRVGEVEMVDRKNERYIEFYCVTSWRSMPAEGMPMPWEIERTGPTLYMAYLDRPVVGKGVIESTRRCGPLRGPSSSSCGGLRLRPFFALRKKRKTFQTILAQDMATFDDS